MKGNLQKLLCPRSIAVIGGGAWCENVVRNCDAIGFSGPVWPIHPTKSHIAGKPALPSLSDLPAPPDATFIGINRHATIKAVADLAKIGAGGAVCFASGFLESDDGAPLQGQLLEAAADMPFFGPNCYGTINYLDGALLWPDQHGGKKTDRGVAIITQSSNIAINITMQRRGLPLAYVISAGNQAQIGVAEIAAQLIKDDRVTALGLHIEGIQDITEYEALADLAQKSGTPIVALKPGKSEQALAAALSHTASLAGGDAGSQALLARLNIASAQSLPEFLEALKLLHVAGPLASRRIVSLSCSGGEAALVADMASTSGLKFPPLTEAQTTDLRAALGPMVALSNPLDYHTFIWNDSAAMANVFSLAMRENASLGLVIADFPRADRSDPADWQCIIEATCLAKHSSAIPVAIAASLPENMPEDLAEELIEQEIVPFCGLTEALAAIEIAAQIRVPPLKHAPILHPKPPRAPHLLNEADAKSALADFGLAIPISHQFPAISGLARAASRLKSPLVLKATGVAHKSEANAVALNLSTPEQLHAAAESMSTQMFLLEEMITGVVAELLIGVVLDEAHGYVLTLGAGGIWAEILDDTESLLIPTDAVRIEASLRKLKIFIILQGYRGQPAADLRAIIDSILSIQAYVIANHGRVAEVEVNPLMALTNGAIAADALIRIGETDD